jgi:hypothetical protein
MRGKKEGGGVSSPFSLQLCMFTVCECTCMQPVVQVTRGCWEHVLHELPGSGYKHSLNECTATRQGLGYNAEPKRT